MSPAGLQRIVEENAWEFFRTMLGKDFHTGRKAVWYISGLDSAFFNGVFDAKLSGPIDDEIRRITGRFSALNLPMTWWVGPSSRPRDLGKRLLRRGFVLEDRPRAMSVRADQARVPHFAGDLRIRLVQSPKELKQWFDVWAGSFELPHPIRGGLLKAFQEKGYSAESDVLNFAGYVGEKMVATVTLFEGGRAAGIYNVGTLPGFRNRGIGSAMTWASLQEANERGQELVVLQASEMGYPIYRKMGFKEHFRFAGYVLEPAVPRGNQA